MSTQEATFMGGVHVPPSKSLTDKVAIEHPAYGLERT